MTWCIQWPTSRWQEWGVSRVLSIRSGPVEIAGRKALVTGATGGIGQAIARALHERGAHVVLTGRRVDVLDAIAEELGDRVEVVPADLSSAQAARELVPRAGEGDLLVPHGA